MYDVTVSVRTEYISSNLHTGVTGTKKYTECIIISMFFYEILHILLVDC